MTCAVIRDMIYDECSDGRAVFNVRDTIASMRRLVLMAWEQKNEEVRINQAEADRGRCISDP